MQRFSMDAAINIPHICTTLTLLAIQCISMQIQLNILSQVAIFLAYPKNL